MRRFLGHSNLTIGPRDRPSVAGIMRRETAANLEPDAIVNPLLPHDALLVVERADPDIVLVETGAMTVGQPWSTAGDPSVGDRGRRLVDIVRAARAIGRPSVLWWSGPRHKAAGLIPMEPLFDLVVAAGRAGAAPSTPLWSTGVQLARFNPIGADPMRPCRPVLAARFDAATPGAWRWPFDVAAIPASDTDIDVWLEFDGYPHHPRSTELPADLMPLVKRWFDTDQAPDTYRSNGLFIAEPVDAIRPGEPVAERTLAQLASGARIISGPDASLGVSLSDWVIWADGPGDDITAATSAGPLALSELRPLMRSLSERHSTARAFEGLMRYLGLNATTASGRDVCAVVRLDPTIRVDRSVDDILRQRQRPAEVLFVGEPTRDHQAVIDELRLARVEVRWMPSGQGDRGDLAEAATRTNAEWLWPMSSVVRYQPEHLLDLMIAAHMSGADAIGWIGGEIDRFVTELSFESSIVSRRAATRVPESVIHDLDRWFAGGASLFGVASTLR